VDNWIDIVPDAPQTAVACTEEERFT